MGAELRVGGAAALGPHDHAVQFYEEDSFLYGTLAEYAVAGFARGEPTLVIAEQARLPGLIQALRERGEEAEERLREGDLVFLDAQGMLDSFMVDGTPSAGAFEEVISGVLRRVRAKREVARLRAHGEMVDILWRQGDGKAAIRLEEMWNRLIEREELQLLCTYAIRNFSTADDAEGFLEVCRHHNHVLPTERFLGLDDSARLSEISLLQQRAHALEAEIESRRAVEIRLREVLAEQEALLASEQAARREAEEANRAKQDFLAVMSHELRTPLNAIAGYAELIELGVHGPVTEAQLQCLERIRGSQQRLLGLIDEVLIYSRTESRKIRFDMQQVPVAEVIRAAERSLLPQLQEQEIDYRAECPAGLTVHADRERLQQILMNLLANALKFAGRRARITVQVLEEPDAVLLRVADSGAGIPQDKLEAVFQPFFQLDNGLTRVHQGAGLGLSISRELARAMGGEITAESRPGEGSSFTVRMGR